MDLNFTAEEEAFRAEVLQFLRDKLPSRLSDKARNGVLLTRDDIVQWHAILNERGWLANHWPREWGGPGWSAVQKFIFETECALAGAPPPPAPVCAVGHEQPLGHALQPIPAARFVAAAAAPLPARGPPAGA